MCWITPSHIAFEDHKTRGMFDPFPFLGTKRKQRIERSWAKVFREPDHKSGAHAAIPLIERAENLGLKPKEALADNPCGSDENCGQAKTMDVEKVSSVIGKLGEETVSLTEFVMSDKNEVLSCPGGAARWIRSGARTIITPRCSLKRRAAAA